MSMCYFYYMIFGSPIQLPHRKTRLTDNYFMLKILLMLKFHRAWSVIYYSNILFKKRKYHDLGFRYTAFMEIFFKCPCLHFHR